MSEFCGTPWPAPAKINLFLHVCGRRPDGYHELQTLFQLLDWGDEVYIEPRDESVICRSGPGFGVPEDEDLSIRAARLLQSETGCVRGASIGIAKRVPMGSGMGGGSSDAATVLSVLNRLWGCGLEISELAELGASLGADVPVFVRGRSALASGIGEKLEPVRLGRRHYVIVFPGVAISTASVFGDSRLKRDSRPMTMEAALSGEGRNDCEAVVRAKWNEMDIAFERLARWGRPVMTGTGSVIFVELPDAEAARRTAQEIKTHYNCRAVEGMDRSLLHEKLYTGGA